MLRPHSQTITLQFDFVFIAHRAIMTTTAPSTAKVILEELKGPGLRENLPVIQHTTAGPSTVPLEPTTAQPLMPTDYNVVTKTNGYNSRTGLPGATAASEQEPNSSVSDSEEENSAVPTPLNISERRKAQNNKFSAWCVVSNKVTASSVNAHRTKQVVKARSQDYK